MRANVGVCFCIRRLGLADLAARCHVMFDYQEKLRKKRRRYLQVTGDAHSRRVMRIDRIRFGLSLMRYGVS